MIVNKKWLVISMGTFEKQCHTREITQGSIKQGEIYFRKYRTFKEDEIKELDFYGTDSKVLFCLISQQPMMMKDDIVFFIILNDFYT